MSFRIAAGEAIPVRLPFAETYRTARGALEGREIVLLRLEDEEGRIGWGEGVPLTLRGGAGTSEVVAALEQWLSMRVGRELSWPGSSATAPPTGGKGSETAIPDAGFEPAFPDATAKVFGRFPAPARCAMLVALADLEARRREIPVWELLGAERAEPVLCNATLVSGEALAVAEDAARWSAEGFGTFKLKVGLAPQPVDPGGYDPDLAVIEAVREAVGGEARVRLDANGAWSFERAAQLLRAAEPAGIELVEQPVATLGEMADLRSRLRGDGIHIPLAADESVRDAGEAAEAMRLGACDLATIKLSKLGHFPPTLGGSLPSYLSSALDGPVGIAAAAHAWQAVPADERARLPARAHWSDRAHLPARARRSDRARLPGRGQAEDQSTTGETGGSDAPTIAQGLATQRLFAESIATRQCLLAGDWLHLPPGPGLGVEIDPDALAAHRL